MNTQPQYRQVPAQVDLPALEHAVLDFWREQKIFAKSLEQSEGRPEWVFYEARPPPTACPAPTTSRPASSRTSSPASAPCAATTWAARPAGLPRPARGAGVEKELGFSGKQDIEAYGIAEFNAKCASR